MKKLVLVLASLALLAPSMALASWWNPLTWFKKAEVVPVVVTEPAVNQEQANTPGGQQLIDETSSWNTYTDTKNKIFSLRYPNTWTYQEESYSLSFKESGSDDSVVVIMNGSDTEKKIDKASENFKVEKVTLGSNVFTKIILSDNPLTPDSFNYYILPLMENAENSSNLIIRTKNPSSVDDLLALLGSIKIDTAQVEASFKLYQAKIQSAQIEAIVANFRATAESYYDTHSGYAGICSPENGSSIDKSFKNLLTIVSGTDIFCNSSNDAYIFYVRNVNKELVCTDSTGVLEVNNPEPKTLSCK